MLVFTQVSSMNTRRETLIRLWWAFQRVRLRATSGRVCSSGSRVFFEAEPFVVHEDPNRPRLGPHTALGQLGRQPPQRERSRLHTIAQPVSDLARQGPGLVPANLSRSQGPRLTLPLGPLGDTGGTDPQRRRDLAVRLARRLARHRPLAKVHGIGSRHSGWPPPPAQTLNQINTDLGIPIP